MAAVSAWLLGALALAALAALRLAFCVLRTRRWKFPLGGRQAVKTLVVLGSGGHTAEMLTLLDRLDRKRYAPLVFVSAHSDASSENRAKRREDEKKNLANCTFLRLPRSREVGQSWLTTVFSTAHACLHALALVARERPDVILCNGPGTGLPICYAALLLHAWAFRPCKIVFVESFCRVDTLSLTGKLLYPISSRFIVQWPELRQQFPRAEYIGRLC
jgi:beta-1,4-N-acetylglucosaminyltransferase